MISKNKIAEIKQLHLKKQRDMRRLFVVEGIKSVQMLLSSSFCVREILVTENVYRDNEAWLPARLVTIVSEADMSRMSMLSTTPEIMAVVEQPSVTMALDENAPLLVLDRIADPGNMGTIIRTADWFDFTQIVCSPDCVELYNPKVIQATMGSFCHVHVWQKELVPFLLEQSPKRRIVGTFLEGTSVDEFVFRQDDIILIGSESHGISSAVVPMVTNAVTVPTFARDRCGAESLNAAVAAALTMHAAKL